MNIRRCLFLVFAALLCALGPPGFTGKAFAQSTAGPFTISSSTSPCATIKVSSSSTVGIQVTGTFSMTLQPEVAIQGQAAANAQATPSTSTTAQSTITATGVYRSAVGGYDTYLVCVTSYASGTATIYLNASPGVNAGLLGGAGFPLLAPSGSNTAPSYSFTADPGVGMYNSTGNGLLFSGISGTASLRIYNNLLAVSAGTTFGWGSGDAFSGRDTGISRLGAGSLAVGSGTNGDVSGALTLATETVQSANGAQWVLGQASELLTLSTSGATTDTTGNLLPATAIIESVVARVTTTITTATNWELGDATIAGRFSAPNSTLIAGTTQVGLVHIDQTGTSGPRQTAAAKVRVTTTGTPGAGAIRITVFYRQLVAPTS